MDYRYSRKRLSIQDSCGGTERCKQRDSAQCKAMAVVSPDPSATSGYSLRSRCCRCGGFLTIGFAPPAQALPSFARQTGQPCGTCHTDFPALTPYGRRFKLLGYTTGGGEFRTTPFSSQAGRDARAEYEKMHGYVKALPPVDNSRGDKEYVPPISMMAIVGFTHTQAPTVAPPTDPYRANDNVVLSPFSGFWGGAITENIGAFAQVTYSAPDPLSALSGTPATSSSTPGPGTIPTSAMPAPRASARLTLFMASRPTTIRPFRMCGTPRRHGSFLTPYRRLPARPPPAR